MGTLRRLKDVPEYVDRLLLLAGAAAARDIRERPPKDIRDSEFRVFSQFGEDGIIQHLINQVAIADETFVEFGVQDYRESNTRFLLEHNNWRGLIIDAGEAHEEFVRTSPTGWRHDLQTVASFVTAESINQLIDTAGFRGDLGLLSVDIDGNDYWVLQSITIVSPRILVIEYNSVFGPEQAVTIPYDPSFDRGKAHYSHLYWGASIAAVTLAAEEKGLALVGGNDAGNNAFYVRRELLGELQELSPSEAWRQSKFRDARDEEGELSYVSDPIAKLKLIRDLPLVRIPEGDEVKISELFEV